MKYKYWLATLCLASSCLFSQEKPDFGASASHTYYVGLLENSKDTLFKDILANYDNHIQNNPDDIVARIERCKFIANAYWDEYEGYNLKYEETEVCIADLYQNYPSEPQVVIYRAENLYGEEQLEVLQAAEELISNMPKKWTDVELAQIDMMLGDYYSDDPWIALNHYSNAQDLNSEIDLSLPIARAYEAQGELERAKQALLPYLEKDTTLWKISQKASLLLKLEEPQKALELYDLIATRDSTYLNSGEMANAMADLGDYEAARRFLVRDTLQEWSRTAKLQTLFDHDLEHSEGDIALLTYRSLQQANSYDDFLGIKRVRVFLKDPWLSWQASEVFHLFLFVVVLFVLFLIPYLWVLPIYGLGALLKKAHKNIVPRLNFDWGIRHFWIISFLYLLVQFLLSVVFYYQENINFIFEIAVVYDEDFESKESLASSSVFFIVAMAICTLLLLKKSVLKLIYHTNMPLLRVLGLSVGFVIFNLMLIKFLGLFISLADAEVSGYLMNAKEEIKAILGAYGFGAAVLLVAVVGPIYEEIIFRGIILGAVEKHIGFLLANILQAGLFAFVHFDFKLFIFFFVFGLIAGYFANKTKGLFTGIIFHVVHNFLILVLLYIAMG